MSNTYVSLDSLKIGFSGHIVALQNSQILKSRLLDLGFLPGTFVTCLHQNSAGDFKAYRIRNTVIALRKEDSNHILIEKEMKP